VPVTQPITGVDAKLRRTLQSLCERILVGKIRNMGDDFLKDDKTI